MNITIRTKIELGFVLSSKGLSFEHPDSELAVDEIIVSWDDLAESAEYCSHVDETAEIVRGLKRLIDKIEEGIQWGTTNRCNECHEHIGDRHKPYCSISGEVVPSQCEPTDPPDEWKIPTNQIPPSRG